jgi:hypothetical protein
LSRAVIARSCELPAAGRQPSEQIGAAGEMPAAEIAESDPITLAAPKSTFS